MRLTFYIHYRTSYGQKLFLSGDTDRLGNWDVDRAIQLNYLNDGLWKADLNMEISGGQLNYKYFIKETGGYTTWEWGENHFIHFRNPGIEDIQVRDAWQDPVPEERALLKSSFSNVIMKPGRNKQKQRYSQASQIIQFNLTLARISQNYKPCLLGNQPSLGSWGQGKVLVMECGDEFPVWSIQLSLKNLKFPLEYKYGIYDLRTQKVVEIEDGSNRELGSVKPPSSSFQYIRNDYHFRHTQGPWKGAGVSVPVFSLHSEESFGVGDFSDLVKFIDWSKDIGLKMVQLLPVNETIAMHSWLDSYPYKAISIMALHPIYLRLEKMGRLDNPELEADFEKHRLELNGKSIVDYPAVLHVKSRYYKLLFDRDGESLFKTTAFKSFFKDNEEWLVPYAAFVYLRDRMKSPDFREWGEYSVYDKEKIGKLCSRKSPSWVDIAVHYFIQYHLHIQLKEAADHARENGIILKGDIPIGVSPNSVEAWKDPLLFNLNSQAGAPPDDFAVKGQNWGFPTYNWEAMAKDNYLWWTSRMKKMSEYFDTYRIDHILGFFRIWEVPVHAVEALLGYFNPALPMSEDEIRSYGVDFNAERFAHPYIRHHLLQQIFGDETEYVRGEFLEQKDDGIYAFREAYGSQKQINDFFLDGIEEEDLDDHQRKIRDGLFELHANVLFINTGNNQWHPRITMQRTSSFGELDDYTRDRMQELYIHYFYRRHEEFWYHKGMEKLPHIASIGNMLVCGEDLGMIPDCVPRAMQELDILSLEIQRMPKDPTRKFAHPADSPYLSVCTSSTHDMSTIRGWWEEDREKIQWFYNKELGKQGQAPYFAEAWICKEIVVQHLYSPAMWVTLPIQDLIAIDGKLRWNETQKEQINQPANVRHRWRYKMKQSIEDLQQAKSFNNLLRKLVRESGRSGDD